MHHIPPASKVFLPVSIEKAIWEYFHSKAAQTGIDISELVSDTSGAKWSLLPLAPFLRPLNKRRHIIVELPQHSLIHINHVSGLVIVITNVWLQIRRDR